MQTQTCFKAEIPKPLLWRPKKSNFTEGCGTKVNAALYPTILKFIFLNQTHWKTENKWFIYFIYLIIVSSVFFPHSFDMTWALVYINLAGKSPIPDIRGVMWISPVSELCHVVKWTLTPVASSSRCCFLEVRSWASISSSYCVSSCFLHTALWKST